MPSSKKTKTSSKKKPKKTTGLVSQGSTCSHCGAPETESLKLQLCSRCGMALYCGAECQRAAHKEHRKFCKQAAEDFDRNDGEAHDKIMFSRCFGGAISLLMHQAQCMKKQRGIIHVKCSHPLVEFCGPRRNEDKRSLVIRYIPEGQPLLDLQQRSLSAGQAKNDAEGMGSLEAALQLTNKMAEDFIYLTGDLKERMAAVAIEQPEIQGLKMSSFFSYMSPDHLGHNSFTALAKQRKQLQVLSRCIVLDWDWDSRNKNPSNEERLHLDGVRFDYPIQWMCYNAVGPQFYQKCSLIYQEKIRSGDSSPWPGGHLTPPLALGIDIRLNDPGSKEKH